MDKRHIQIYSICVRYSILAAIGLANILLGFQGIFYKVFTPLTITPVFFILNNLYGALLIEPNVIFFKGYFANIIPACVAGAAYFFLLILNLTTPMPAKKRIFSILFLFSSFLVLNIIRISFFGALIFQGYKYFDIAHLAAWYFGSTLMVVALWFVNIKLFKISSIPAYTDIMHLLGLSRRTRGEQ